MNIDIAPIMTVVGGVGLVATGFYQCYTGNVQTGIQSVLAGLALFGLHVSTQNGQGRDFLGRAK